MLLSQVADPAQVVVHELVALDPHAVRPLYSGSCPDGSVPAATVGRMGTTTPPRTLAEALRARGDESLAGLLRARPDLLNPVPNDITQLATRAGTRASVVRALEHLDRFALQTAEALAVAPDPARTTRCSPSSPATDSTTANSATTWARRSPPRVPGALATLREQALVWGEDDRLRLVRTARELLRPVPAAPLPTGLGPTVAEATAGMSPGRLQEILAATGLPATHDPVSAVAALSALFTDRTRMAELLDTAPVEALSVLDRLVWGPPYGEVTPEPHPAREVAAGPGTAPAGVDADGGPAA